MSYIRALFFSLFFVSLLPPALASQDCPLIRPAGLSDQQVDAIVTDTYSQGLRRSPRGLDVSKTIKDLDGTENAIMTYAFATLSIGQSLGFDASKAFYDAAKAKGDNQPFESLSLAELQALTRIAYSNGIDSPPPEATEGSIYKVQSVLVSSPVPAQGWRVIQCKNDTVTFQRQASTSLTTASIRIVRLPPFTSDAVFLTAVATLLPNAVPKGFQLQPWEPRLATNTKTPCVDATLVGTGSEGSLLLRARICYEDKSASFGYAGLFSHVSQESAQAPTAQAESFVMGTSPK